METLEEQYERVRGKVSALEAERANYLARGLEPPSRIRFRLLSARADLDEIRLHGHREMLREVEEAQKRAAERDMLERVRVEWDRIDAMPVLSPEDLRRKRIELGVRQQDVATFAGVSLTTVNKAENGGNCEPMTLKLIAAGLEKLEEFRA
jgi:DNA-binding XRE family transcriptional regulator